MASISEASDAIMHPLPRGHAIAAAVSLCLGGCSVETRVAGFEDDRNRELGRPIDRQVVRAARDYPEYHSVKEVGDSTIYTVSNYRGCSWRYVVETVTGTVVRWEYASERRKCGLATYGPW